MYKFIKSKKFRNLYLSVAVLFILSANFMYPMFHVRLDDKIRYLFAAVGAIMIVVWRVVEMKNTKKK
ncbi:hypothetical protein [Bacillus sp. 03113]|uniref:hypothetical protein n=1 Tax=Bacillus sp. 03113 TaxID=2578211 RepID=UPI001143B3AC|nr:hypothetical protein [Bacillus sp. 03113]